MDNFLLFFGLLPLVELFQSMKQSKALTILVICALFLFVLFISILFLL